MSTAESVIAFVLYFAAVVALGLRVGRGVTTCREDYFVARRAMPGWLVAFAAAAAGESGWVMMGLVGAGYNDGVSCFWLIPGCIIGYAFNILALGPALQAQAASTGAVTVAEVIGAGTGARNGAARRVAAAIIVVFLGCYIAAQFTAGGKAFSSFLGLDYGAGTALAAAIVVAYTVLGGQKSIAWTHLVQASMMVLTLLVVPIAGLIAVGGLSALLQGLRASDPALLSAWRGSTGWAAVGLVLGWSGVGFGYPGQPHVLMQYLSGRSKEDVRSGWLVSIAWGTLVFAGAILAGMVARGWIRQLSDPEHGLPALAERLLPAWGQGLVLAAILAAICSTADSQILAVTAALGVDVLGLERIESVESWRRKVSTRVLFVLVAVAALLFAMTEARVIFTFVLYAWGVLGAGLGPVIIAVAFGRQLSSRGAVAAMLSGAGIAVIWQSVPTLKGLIYELVPAFLVGLAVTWALSRAAMAPSAAQAEREGTNR